MKKAKGLVVENKSNGINQPTIVKVEYEVYGQIYELKEIVKVKTETVKWGLLSIGQRRVPVIDCREGSTVTVLYDETNPSRARIEGNTGLVSN